MVRNIAIKLVLAAAIALLAAYLSQAWCDTNIVVQHVGSPFCGLNDQDNPVVIPVCNAQDLLNVDITPGGLSVKKRHGSGLDTTLNISTSAVHGGYHFYDSNGNDIRLWMNDQDVSSSKNSGAYSVIISTLTDNATLQCIDSQGFAWCADSKNDSIFRTDGTNVTWFNSIATGTMVTAGPDRLAIANVPGNQNSIYFSASGDFTNFTTGSQPSSPFIESILAPGSHITHIRYSNGRYLWWKDQSFGYVLLQDQFNLQIVVVSYLVGTLDNTSVENEGIVYFRGQDNHIWAYDGASLTRLTREITPIVNGTNFRKQDAWIQTSQSDFQNGSAVLSNSISYTLLPGSIVLSTFGVTDSSFPAGTLSNSRLRNGGVQLDTLYNPSFETGPDTLHADNWNVSDLGNNFRLTQSGQGVTCSSQILMPHQGSYLGLLGESSTCAGSSAGVELLNANTSALISSVTATNNCNWTAGTLNAGNNVGTVVEVEGFINGGACSNLSVISDTFTLAGNVSFYYAFETSFTDLWLDDFSTVSTGTFTSQVFDTAITSVTAQVSTYTQTGNSFSTTYALQSATSTTGSWSTLTTSTGTNGSGNEFLRYIATMTFVTGGGSTTTLNSTTLIAISTGATYFSAVNSAPNLTSWGNFAATDSDPGFSTITYFTRSSTNSFTVLSSTPAWVTQTKNATVAASTGTYMQMKGVFSVTAATESPTLNDFTFNWNEGTASDKAYATYFDFGIWWSISYSTAATTNNRILRYDLINQTWTVYDLKSNGFMVQNNKLYFGDPTAGKTYVYAAAEDDNGAAINAYWKSKDFSNAGLNPFIGYNALDTPFNQKDYRTLSTFSALQSTGTLNVTYTLDRVTANTFSLNMVDPNGLNVVHQNYYLPQGTIGTTLSVQFGNNAADQPFEIFGSQFEYVPKPWKPYP